MAIKTYKADRACPSCGYQPSLRRAKADSAEVTYDTDHPEHITVRCLRCGHVRVLTTQGAL